MRLQRIQIGTTRYPSKSIGLKAVIPSTICVSSTQSLPVISGEARVDATRPAGVAVLCGTKGRRMAARCCQDLPRQRRSRQERG